MLAVTKARLVLAARARIRQRGQGRCGHDGENVRRRSRRHASSADSPSRLRGGYLGINLLGIRSPGPDGSADKACRGARALSRQRQRIILSQAGLCGPGGFHRADHFRHVRAPTSPARRPVGPGRNTSPGCSFIRRASSTSRFAADDLPPRELASCPMTAGPHHWRPGQPAGRAHDAALAPARRSDWRPTRMTLGSAAQRYGGAEADLASTAGPSWHGGLGLAPPCWPGGLSRKLMAAARRCAAWACSSRTR